MKTRLGTQHLLRASRRRRRRGASSGQALVEFAAFVFFVVMMVSGVANVGFLLDDHLSMVYATRQGARTAAVLGNQSSSDCAIIGAINSALAGLGNIKLNRIIIYRAGLDGKPQGSTSETIYTDAGSGITCTVSGSTITVNPAPVPNNYPPSSRNNQAFIEDSVGVEVDYTYTFQFPYQIPGLNGTFNSSDATVMPVNPVSVPTPVG